jgi:hypothetical protein
MLTVRDYVTADGPIARCAKYGKLCSGFVENLKGLVGAEGFEPPTLCSQSRLNHLWKLVESERK